MRILTGVAAVLVSVTLAGCSASVSVGRQVDGDDVAKQVSSQLEAQVGRAPEKVECPDALDAKVGATIRCTLTDSGESYGVTVTAESVDGSTVHMDIKVDEEPSSTD